MTEMSVGETSFVPRRDREIESRFSDSSLDAATSSLRSLNVPGGTAFSTKN